MKANRKYIISGVLFTLLICLSFTLVVWTLAYTHIILILISPFGFLFGAFHKIYDKTMNDE